MPSNDEFAKEQLVGPQIAYQLVVSKWGAAAVLAGLDSLLQNDTEMEPQQRFAIAAMGKDIRDMLSADSVKLLGSLADDEVIEADPVDDFEDNLPPSGSGL